MSDENAQKRGNTYLGLISCANCGCSVTHSVRVKNYVGTSRLVEYSYYHCTNGKGTCNKCAVSEDYVTETIAAVVNSLNVPQEVLNFMKQASGGWEDTTPERLQSALNAFMKDLDGAKRRMQNLVDARLSDPDLFTPAEFKSQKARISSEITQLESQMAIMKDRAAKANQSIMNAVNFALSAKRRFNSIESDTQREVVRRLGESYCLTLGKLEITVHPLLAEFVTIGLYESGYSKVEMASFGHTNPVWSG